MVIQKSKLAAVYGVHDGSCIVSEQECVLCHFKVDHQPKKVQDILYKWLKHFEKPKSTTAKEKKALARRVEKLSHKHMHFVLKFIEAMTDPDSPWVTTGQSRALTSRVDIKDEALPVQRLCWELLGLIKAQDSVEKPDLVAWSNEHSDWMAKAMQLPKDQLDVVKDFCSSLRWVWVKKDDLSGRWGDSFGGSYSDNTTAMPISVGIH